MYPKKAPVACQYCPEPLGQAHSVSCVCVCDGFVLGQAASGTIPDKIRMVFAGACLEDDATAQDLGLSNETGPVTLSKVSLMPVITMVLGLQLLWQLPLAWNFEHLMM
jgi:hypothetical protein